MALAPVQTYRRRRVRLDKLLNVETSAPKAGTRRHRRKQIGYFTKPTNV